MIPSQHEVSEMKSEYYQQGYKMGHGGHAAGLRPSDLTREQDRDWLDGYLAGQTELLRRSGALRGRPPFGK